MNNDFQNRINELGSSKEGYCIDILPYKIESDIFFELEDILYKKKLNEFANKIAYIVSVLRCYFDCEIFITEYPEEGNYKYSDYSEQLLQNISLKKFYNIVKYIIKKDISSAQIIIHAESNDALLRINGGFSVDLYCSDDSIFSCIEKLIHSEGLFLRVQE